MAVGPGAGRRDAIPPALAHPMFKRVTGRQVVASSSRRKASTASCGKTPTACFTPWAISPEKRLAWPTTRLAYANNCR
jgi:hypothetical protein